MVTTEDVLKLNAGDFITTIGNRLCVTSFLVEADSFATTELHNNFCTGNSLCRFPKIERWENINGFSVTVGDLDNRPVVICLSWSILDGTIICFWEATSQVVDYQLIEDWFKKYYLGPKCDANNFHQCLDVIEKNKS